MRFSRKNGLSLTAMLIGVVFFTLAVSLGVYKLLPRGENLAERAITHTVKQGLFVYDVVERGEVESSSNVEVKCEVKAQGSGGMTILEVIPEGTEVKKGDILVELDSSGLEQELVQQQIACSVAEASMITQRNGFEAAEIAKLEYMEGTFQQEEQTIQSEIFIAEENLRKAEEYFSFSTRLAARGYVSPQQLEGDRFAVEKAKTELEAARTKLRVLQEYTKPKMLKELESAIRSAEANWKSDENSYRLELDREKELEEQIKKCTLRATQAGQAIHANETSRRGDSDFIVEAGATVREGQAIIRLPDNSKMQVRAKVNESRITDLSVGLPVTIRIDAFGDETLSGVVTAVNEYPEPTSWYSSQVKEYATFVKINEPETNLKPGLTAQVTIHVANVPDALLVPIQAVYEHGRQTYCFVQVKEGIWSARKVEIARDNDKFAMVQDGLEEGAVVAMNPDSLLSLVDLPKLTVEQPQGGRPGGGRPVGKKRTDDTKSRSSDAA